MPPIKSSKKIDIKTDRKKTNKEERKKERKQMSKQTKDKQPNQNRTHSPLAVPPGAGLLGVVAVYEAAQTHGSSQRQHHGVETQPGKINTDLLAVIFSVDDNNNSCSKDFPYSCFLYIPYHTGPYSTTPKKTPHPNITIPHYTIPHHTTP